jgi:hypothetical protein
MIRLPGYETVGTICENDNTIVFRVCWSENYTAVILKVLKEDHSSPVDVSRYQHEFTIIRFLTLEYVVKAYAMRLKCMRKNRLSYLKTLAGFH